MAPRVAALRRPILIALFLTGAGLRAIDLWHPVDGTIREPWRECDVASIARNFYREDARFLYPRIDWRGDGPGYAEMEFPVTPWAISVLYRVFGFHEVAGRILVYGFALLSLGIFFRLAAYLLPPGGAIAASLFFVLSPLAVRISNTLQPDGLMFLTYVLAVYAFVRWLDGGRWRDYTLALLATALTILAKASAAHLGVLFAVLLLWRQGWVGFRQVRVWALAVLSLAPALAWYAHAHGFWTHYGNSLGLSNEYHWIGWDFFTNPAFVRNILASDVFLVWMPTGLLVATFGIIMRFHEKATRIALAWMGAVAIFYAVASRTTGDAWAVYYHVVSVPAVALLFGVGVEALAAGRWRPTRMVLALGIVTVVVAVAVLRLAHLDLGYESGLRFVPVVVAAAAAFAALVLLVRRRAVSAPEGTPAPTAFSMQFVALPVSFLVPLTFALQLNQIRVQARPDFMRGAYDCARQFAPLIPRGSLVLEGGAECYDQDGYPVAHNEPFMFYWLDRKGFNLCNEEQSLRAVAALRARGARFYMVKKVSLHHQPGYEHALRATYPVLSECTEFLLFSLEPRAAQAGSP